jgi:SAM-dependent methyltransferase
MNFKQPTPPSEARPAQLEQWLRNKGVRFLSHLSTKQHFLANLYDSERVLDLGCGTGNNGDSLKKLYPGIEIHGVDTLAEAAVPAYYVYKAVDLEKGALPYPDEYFDAVLFTHVVEHLHSPFQIGSEINRVAKRGAQIYVETPNWTSILVPSFGFHREQRNPFNLYDDPTHIRPWTQHTLFEFIYRGCGFKVVKLGSTRVWTRIPLDFAMIILGIIAGNRKYIVSAFWNLYGWSIYGVGTKERG